MKVEADGLAQRIAVLPIPASNYGQLTSVGDKLFYGRKGKLWAFELDKQKETELGDYGSYRVTADRKKMMVRGGSTFAIVDLPGGRIDTKDKELNLGDVKVNLDRHAEWNQIYTECWRQMRDFLFDPNLHGVDWPAMRRRYEPLLAHVQHRNDLTYVIGEMISELNIGHAYVGGGDRPAPERIPLGLLGARISKHAERVLLHPRNPARAQLGQEVPLAAYRDRRERQGRRLHRRDRRPAGEPTERPVRRAGREGGPSGDAAPTNAEPKADVPTMPSSCPPRTSIRSITSSGCWAISRPSARPPTAASATCTSRTWACRG